MVAPPTLLLTSSSAIFMALTMVSDWPLLLPVLGSDDTILMEPVSWPDGAAAGDAAATGEADEATGEADEATGDATALVLAAGDAAAIGDADEATGDAAAAGDAAAGDAAAGAVVGLAGAAVGVVAGLPPQADSSAAPPVMSTTFRKKARRECRRGSSVWGYSAVMFAHSSTTGIDRGYECRGCCAS